jgi:hypothetical protein
MKTTYPLIILAGLLWNSLALASDALLIGPATIKFSCRSQALYYQQISSKTNFVGSNTNVTSVYKSTVTNFTMDATSLLDLFANSLNTNFPSGTKLLLYGGSGYFTLAISDSTGTNISLPVVVGLLNAYDEGLVSVGRSTQSTTNQVLVAGNDTEAFISAIQFQYNDFPQTNTTDGTRSLFHLNCRLESKQSKNLATGLATENVTMTVTGGGFIHNGPAVIITGTIRGTTSGMP